MRLSCTVFELLSLISLNLKTSRDRDGVTTPTQGAVGNISAKASHGEPLMANQCTKFEVSSFSRSGDNLGESKKIKWVT